MRNTSAIVVEMPSTFLLFVFLIGAASDICLKSDCVYCDTVKTGPILLVLWHYSDIHIISLAISLFTVS